MSEEEKKEVKSLISESDIVVKKKTLGDRIRDVFLADDIENVKEYAISDVIIPGIKNLIVDSIAMLILGDGDYRRRGRRDRDDRERVSYNTRYKYADDKDERKSRRKKDDDDCDFEEIIFKTLNSADDVLNGMYELLREYNEVTVKDYYTLAHYKSTVFDDNWGWESLKGVRIKRCRGGYILTLPDPISLE